MNQVFDYTHSWRKLQTLADRLFQLSTLPLDRYQNGLYLCIVYNIDVFLLTIHHFTWGTVSLIACAPITHDGERLSSLMYAIIVENQSDTEGEGVLELPSLYKKKYSDTRNVLIECRETQSHNCISFTFHLILKKNS